MNHVPADLLAAFVDGDVSEQVAIHVALHIDECPSCANRAVHLEPLGRALASVPDPVAPADLRAAIIEELATPEAQPSTEVLVGLGLLAAAAVLALVMGDPVQSAVQITLVANMLAHSGALLTSAVVSSTMMMPLAMFAATASCLAAVRLVPAVTDRSYP